MPAAAASQPDRLVQWLLGGVEWKATVFHLGQYCGRWRASTSGHGLASFHAVLHGRCFLHRPGHPALPLQPGDAVFLLNDLPHHLLPSEHPNLQTGSSAMQALQPAQVDGTALACGFFHFAGPLCAWLLGAFDEPLLLRRDDQAPDLQHAARVFEMIHAEAGQAGVEGHPSPLLERLIALLFHYVLRHALRCHALAAGHAGLWALARDPALAPLLEQMLRTPGAAWTAERMAAAVHMSRARFFRAFNQACGEPPAQFLQRLRMQIAAQRLHGGESVTRAAEHVGYGSNAAFTRAFTRVLGLQPGAWQRAQRLAQ